MNVVVLTGAGSSKPFDYPTTLEFFPQESELSPVDREVYQLLRRQLKSELVDVEAALEILQSVEEFMPTSGGRFIQRKLTDGWYQKTKDFTKYVRDRCFLLYGAEPDAARVAELYGPFLEVLGWEQQRLSLFTTNYDPVTDYVLDLAEENELPCTDGFRQRGTWDEALYDKGTAGIDVYRLHGSMSWVYKADRVVNTRDYSLRSGKCEHLLIYPGYKGNPTEEKHPLYAFGHEQLRQQLRRARLLVVVGFSFRDRHINMTIRESLSKNLRLTLAVLNPEWPAGLQNVLGSKQAYGKRVKHLECGFGDEVALRELRALLRRPAA